MLQAARDRLNRLKKHADWEGELEDEGLFMPGSKVVMGWVFGTVADEAWAVRLIAGERPHRPLEGFVRRLYCWPNLFMFVDVCRGLLLLRLISLPQETQWTQNDTVWSARCEVPASVAQT